MGRAGAGAARLDRHRPGEPAPTAAAPLPRRAHLRHRGAGGLGRGPGGAARDRPHRRRGRALPRGGPAAMRALIIDDEAPARSALRALLREHPSVVLAGEADTLDSAVRRLAAADYDLVFLDVQLRGGTGFDLVPHVRPEARIVFVTAFDHFAARAFEVNALDYLVKPVRPQRLAAALRRVVAPPAETPASAPAATLAPDDLVYLKTGNGASRFVRLADIAAIESDENYSIAHLDGGTRLFVRRTMKAWEDSLPPAQFVRVHRSTIVNLARYRGADRVSSETTLLRLAGLPEPVRASFRYLPELRERLAALGRQL
ncbi:MAG: DNA-binding response regulator [Opitutus sp.]|nr:DNA-binding response regulator [Opitutus sp.]